MLIVYVKVAKLIKLTTATFPSFSQRRRRGRGALFQVFTKLPSSLAPQIYSVGADWRRVTWPDGNLDIENIK